MYLPTVSLEPSFEIQGVVLYGENQGSGLNLLDHTTTVREHIVLLGDIVFGEPSHDPNVALCGVGYCDYDMIAVGTSFSFVFCGCVHPSCVEAGRVLSVIVSLNVIG